MELGEGRFSIDNIKHLCNATTTEYTNWGLHVRSLACRVNETGSAGELFLQVDEYASRIVPLSETCPWLIEGQSLDSF